MPKPITPHLCIKAHVAPQILHAAVFCSSSDQEVLLCFGKICYGKSKIKGEPDSEKEPCSDLWEEEEEDVGEGGWWKRGGFFKIVEAFLFPSQTKTLELGSSYCLAAVLNRGGSCSWQVTPAAPNKKRPPSGSSFGRTQTLACSQIIISECRNLITFTAH